MITGEGNTSQVDAACVPPPPPLLLLAGVLFIRESRVLSPASWLLSLQTRCQSLERGDQSRTHRVFGRDREKRSDRGRGIQSVKRIAAEKKEAGTQVTFPWRIKVNKIKDCRLISGRAVKMNINYVLPPGPANLISSRSAYQ